MAASLLSESAGDEPTASVGVGDGLAIVRPVMPSSSRNKIQKVKKSKKSWQSYRSVGIPRKWIFFLESEFSKLKT